MTHRLSAGQKIQYPFVVRPHSGHWEVLVINTDRPYQEALFQSKAEAAAFAEARNECWREAQRLTYALIVRLNEAADLELSSSKAASSKRKNDKLERYHLKPLSWALEFGETVIAALRRAR